MIVKCPECGMAVSDKAEACPHCGVLLKNGAAVTVSGLKRSVAFAFAVFLGELGGHNFYLGYKRRGNIELILFIVGLVTFPIGGCFVIWPVLWLWGIIETLSYKTDSDGEMLKW